MTYLASTMIQAQGDIQCEREMMKWKIYHTNILRSEMPAPNFPWSERTLITRTTEMGAMPCYVHNLFEVNYPCPPAVVKSTLFYEVCLYNSIPLLGRSGDTGVIQPERCCAQLPLPQRKTSNIVATKYQEMLITFRELWYHICVCLYRYLVVRAEWLCNLHSAGLISWYCA